MANVCDEQGNLMMDDDTPFTSIGDQPAFPTLHIGRCAGMTLRQWLIGKALTGNLAWSPGDGCLGYESGMEAAGVAIEAADAVITRLDAERGKSRSSSGG